MDKIAYNTLNARQKENFNFQKVSAVLADYGYVTIRLSDDWNGADFIALHISGSILRIQLKGRLYFDKKYCNKGLYLTFASEGVWYLYPHDELLEKVCAVTQIKSTRSWQDKGIYHFPHLSREYFNF
jgi:hypothetical protein